MNFAGVQVDAPTATQVQYVSTVTLQKCGQSRLLRHQNFDDKSDEIVHIFDEFLTECLLIGANLSVQAVIPLHLAAQCGHVAVVGLLLRFTFVFSNKKFSLSLMFNFVSCNPLRKCGYRHHFSS